MIMNPKLYSIINTAHLLVKVAKGIGQPVVQARPGAHVVVALPRNAGRVHVRHHDDTAPAKMEMQSRITRFRQLRKSISNGADADWLVGCLRLQSDARHSSPMQKVDSKQQCVASEPERFTDMSRAAGSPVWLLQQRLEEVVGV